MCIPVTGQQRGQLGRPGAKPGCCSIHTHICTHKCAHTPTRAHVHAPTCTLTKLTHAHTHCTRANACTHAGKHTRTRSCSAPALCVPYAGRTCAQRPRPCSAWQTGWMRCSRPDGCVRSAETLGSRPRQQQQQQMLRRDRCCRGCCCCRWGCCPCCWCERCCGRRVCWHGCWYCRGSGCRGWLASLQQHCHQAPG